MGLQQIKFTPVNVYSGTANAFVKHCKIVLTPSLVDISDLFDKRNTLLPV